MTSSVGPLTFYPQYCFVLSTTLRKFCHLRAADIANKLTCQDGFEGQDLWFYNNHPIKWIRVAGMVIGIDNYSAKRIYTVDDGSGVTIECIETPSKDATDQKSNPFLPSDQVNLGDIIDVKGVVKVYNKHGEPTRQVYARKVAQLRSTEQEVALWEQMNKLRIDILDHPWVPDARAVEKLRKKAEGSGRREKDQSAAPTRITGLEKRKKVKVTRKAEIDEDMTI